MFKRVHNLNVEEKIVKFCRKNLYFFCFLTSAKKRFLLNICNFFLLKFRVHKINTFEPRCRKTCSTLNQNKKKNNDHFIIRNQDFKLRLRGNQQIN